MKSRGSTEAKLRSDVGEGPEKRKQTHSLMKFGTDLFFVSIAW